MAFEFKLPDLGEGVQEGEIVRWLVSEGDVVQPEQHLVEVMTDKVTAELPAPVGGRIVSLNGAVGEVVPVGHVLVEIETEEAAPAFREPEEAPAVDLPPAAAAPPVGSIPLAAPAVRRLARDLGVDLAQVRGSGPEGRIREADIRQAVGESAEPAAEAVTRVPLRGMRRAIAEHLLTSHRETAPYTYVEEVDFTELVALRTRVQPLAEKSGVRLTYLPLILAAVSIALGEHPHLNATVDSDSGDLLLHQDHHLSVAVQTEEGLVVPVIRAVQRRNLLELAAEIERLSAAARSGTLTRDEVTGGTFSVTSLGRLGGLMATPMLHTPQVAILGIHKIAARPVVRENAIVSRQMANLSLTLDHRYLDGQAGALFIQTLKQYLEDPALMLFWLAELKS